MEDGDDGVALATIPEYALYVVVPARSSLSPV